MKDKIRALNNVVNAFPLNTSQLSEEEVEQFLLPNNFRELFLDKFDYHQINTLYKTNPKLTKALVNIYASLSKAAIPEYLELHYHNFSTLVRSLKDWNPIKLIQELDLTKKTNIQNYLTLFKKFTQNELIALKKDCNTPELRSKLAEFYVKAEMYGLIPDNEITAIKQRLANLYGSPRTRNKTLETYIHSVHKKLNIDEFATELHQFFVPFQKDAPSLNLSKLKETLERFHQSEEGGDELVPKIIYIIKQIPVLKPGFQLTRHDLEKTEVLIEAVTDKFGGEMAYPLTTLYSGIAISIAENAFDTKTGQVDKPFTKQYATTNVPNIINNTIAMEQVKKIVNARKILQPIINQSDIMKSEQQSKISLPEKEALIKLDGSLQTIQRRILSQVGVGNVTSQKLQSNLNQINDFIVIASTAEKRPSTLFERMIHAISTLFNKPDFILSKTLNHVTQEVFNPKP